MAYIMFQYDRPTATQNWNNYNRHVRDWISQLLNLPGAVSFVAYRTTGEASPDTMTMLEVRSVGAAAKVLVLERSPFTPEPIPA
jgi:hypothetical protein